MYHATIKYSSHYPSERAIRKLKLFYLTIGWKGAIQKCKRDDGLRFLFFIKLLKELEHLFILFALFQDLDSLFHIRQFLGAEL